MRLILTLVAVLIIGLLVAKQLQSPTVTPDSDDSTSGNVVPTVPTRPQDVPQFEQDMNQFINQSNAEQSRLIDEATKP